RCMSAITIRRIGLASLVVFGFATVSCGRGSGPAPGAAAPAGGPPPMPVEVVTLVPKPVEDTGEFVGAIKSRQSSTVQPQVEGFLTKILVKSGDRVRPGAVLMEIDAASQQAAVASLQSVRAAREADAGSAPAQVGRAKALQ